MIVTQHNLSRRRERGAALVIVLAFVVLLAGLVVAYFSRAMSARQLSNSSFNQAKADELARSALDIITSDLKQEIADPSASDAKTVGNVTIYSPKTNANIVPVKNTPTNPTSTLLRISTTNAIVAPGVDHAASAAITTIASSNGRSIAPARWNKHYLIPRDLTKYSPPTKIGTEPVPAFTAPSWVFITDKGPQVIASPTTSVIGRYAYAIYDEGALLDVNVAGFPNTGGTIMPASAAHPPPDTNNLKQWGYAGKGSLAFADLTALGLPQAQIDNLAGWRNYASAQPNGSFAANFTFNSAGATRFYDTILTNTNGFLKVSNATWNSNTRTDQAFLARQELLNLRASFGFAQDSLQYLGTFSRALNAPSWSPKTPAGSTIDYAANADDRASLNRNLSNVRFPNAATITHYKDDGTTSNYNVQAGDPLLQRRFSLAKLAWFTPSGPATGRDQAIKDCFGLQWDSTKWRWDYVAAKLPPGVAIKTLDQVASESREPNFFELLNAGILSGSLGRDPGKGMDESIAGGVGVYSSQFDKYKTEPNLHILQIGTNIIDQYDGDSYPTAVHFDAWGFTGADDVSLQTVYGVENVPLLLGLSAIAIADPIPPGGGGNGGLKSWVQPQLWNPHQVPSTALSDYPAGFRAYAYGKMMIAWSEGSGWSPHYSPWTAYDDGLGNLGTSGSPGVIYFNNPGNSTSPFYSAPNPLTLDLKTSSGVLVVDQAQTPSTNYYDASKWSALGGDVSPPNQFVGFSLSADPNYNPDPNTGFVSRKMLLPDLASRAYFSLQYKGPDGNYHPYNFMARLTQDQDQKMKRLKPSRETNVTGVKPTTTVVGETASRGTGPARLDPRTDRFSESSQGWSGKTLETMNPAPNSYNPPSGSGAGGPGDFGIPFAPGFTYVPTYNPAAPTTPPTGGEMELFSRNDKSYSVTISATSKNAYYADLDGVIRFGDGYRGNIASGDGAQLYLGTASVNPSSTLTTPGTGSVQSRRPVILNRPFRSVGELGFVHRDLPFKSIDLWSASSGDSALLDVFSVSDQTSVIAGQVNPNNASAAVLQAIIAGTSKSEALGVQITGNDPNSTASPKKTYAQELAEAVVTNVSGANGPYISRAELATRLGPIISGTTAGTVFTTSNATYYNWANKAYAEAPIRALADVTNTRTWNLLIDVVAQSGQFPASSPATLAALNSSFIVQGERRYWLHVAIDRFTGKVVDQQLEPVYE